jgi:hypothetical protein
MSADYKKDFEGLVSVMASEGASDLHLSEGRKPIIRANGILIPLENYPVLTHADMKGIKGNLLINTTNLTDLTGLDSLSFIGKDLNIWFTKKLVNLKGLDNLKSIGGQLDIYFNYDIENLTGLNQLDSVGTSIYVGGNSLLVSITALNKIKKVQNPEIKKKQKEITALREKIREFTVETQRKLLEFASKNEKVDKEKLAKMKLKLLDRKDSIQKDINKLKGEIDTLRASEKQAEVKTFAEGLEADIKSEFINTIKEMKDKVDRAIDGDDQQTTTYPYKL